MLISTGKFEFMFHDFSQRNEREERGKGGRERSKEQRDSEDSGLISGARVHVQECLR